MIDKYKSTKCIGHLFELARKRKTTATIDRLIQCKVKFDRRKSASMVKVEIENRLGISLHVDTIRKRAHELRLFGQVARKKPYVNKINRGKLIKVAKKMFENLVDFWKNVVWSDESKFNLFNSDGKVMVRRTPSEEFDPKCTIPKVKHGDGSVMVCDCLTRQEVGKLCVLDRITKRLYFRDILEQNLQPSINHFKPDQRCIFIHENDPKHTSGLNKDWLKRKRIQTLPWPPYSLDFNPIENLWDELERRVKNHQPKNITGLWFLGRVS